jgi:hypothetical protein
MRLVPARDHQANYDRRLIKTGGLSRRVACRDPSARGRRAAVPRRPDSHGRTAIQKPLLNMTFWYTIGLNQRDLHHRRTPPHH